LRKEKELEKKENREIKAINVFFSLSYYLTKVYTNAKFVSRSRESYLIEKTEARNLINV